MKTLLKYTKLQYELPTGDTAWTNPGRAVDGDNNTFATITLAPITPPPGSEEDRSNVFCMTMGTNSFDVPIDNVVTGYEIKILCDGNNVVADTAIGFVCNGVSLPYTVTQNITVPTVKTELNLSGVLDVNIFTPAIVNDPSFGFWIGATGPATINIYSSRVSITHTLHLHRERESKWNRKLTRFNKFGGELALGMLYGNEGEVSDMELSLSDLSDRRLVDLYNYSAITTDDDYEEYRREDSTIFSKWIRSIDRDQIYGGAMVMGVLYGVEAGDEEVGLMMSDVSDRPFENFTRTVFNREWI